MTTRANGSSGSQDSEASAGEVVKFVGGEDIDHDRPAKIAKRSSSRDAGDPRPVQSSPLSAVAADAQHLVPDGYGSEVESQASQAGLQELDEDAVAEADRDGFEEELQSQLQSQLQSRAVSASQRTTPALGSRQVSPSKPSSRSPTKVKGRRAKLAQSSNGRILDRSTPDPGEPGGLLKRLPGRRRAPHPDLNIEVDLRRQLELKIAYRAVAKALKPVLLDLADRAARELESDEQLHKQYPEYQEIVEELEWRLNQRLRMLEAQLQEEEARLQREYEAKHQIVRGRYASALQDQRDDHLLRCENALMARAQEAREEDDSDATEYEDDIVPSLYRVDLETQARRKIDEAYDSRSRWFIETQRLWESQSARESLRKVQDIVDKDSLDPRSRGFAVYDGAQRAAAVNSLNLLQLVDASEDVEDSARQLKMLSEAPNPALAVLADVSSNQQHAQQEQQELTPTKPTNEPGAQGNNASANSVNGSTSAKKSLTQPYNAPSIHKKSAPRKHKALKNAQIPLYLPDPGMLPAAGPYPPYEYFPYYMPYPYPPLPPGVSPAGGTAEDTKPVVDSQHSAAAIQDRKPSQTERLTAHYSGVSNGTRNDLLDTAMPDAMSYSGRQEASPLRQREHDAQPGGAQHHPSTNKIAAAPLYHPRYVDDMGLVKPPSPSADEQTAQGPSNPNEWPGFSSGPSTSHGRAASFDTNFARPPAFPMLAPNAARGKPPDSQPPVLGSKEIANKERRSASSPDAPRFDAFGSRTTSHASLSYMQAPATSNQATHHGPSFMGFPRSYQPSAPPSSLFTHPKRESPAPDSKQAFRPPTASTPPLRNPYEVGFSPSRFPQGLTRPVSRSSRPTSPLTKPPVRSSNMPLTAQNRPESRPSSPMAQVRAYWGMQASPPGTQEASARTSQQSPSLQPQPTQPQAQLQRAGQQGHQRILPASLDPSRRPSQDVVPKSEGGIDGMHKGDLSLPRQDQHTSFQTKQHQPHSLYNRPSHQKEQRPSAFSSRNPSYQQLSAPSTSPNAHRIGQTQTHAPSQSHSQTVQKPQPWSQPQAQTQSPSQPRDQKSMQSRFPVSHLSLPDNSSATSSMPNFINTSSSTSTTNTGVKRSTSRGRKEPRQPGQLRWQHYANIAPAPSASAAPTTPSPAAYPSASYGQQGFVFGHSQQQQQQQQKTPYGQQPTFAPSSVRQPPHHHQSQQEQAFAHNQQHPPLHRDEASPAAHHGSSCNNPPAPTDAPAQVWGDLQSGQRVDDERLKEAQQTLAVQREESERRQRVKNDKWQRNFRGWAEG